MEAERSGEVAVYMRIHATEFCPIFRKVAILVCTKKIREKRDREVKKAWKGAKCMG